MAAQLPPIPRYLFTIIEPISLIAGALGPLLDPSGFVTNQLPLQSPATIASATSALARFTSIFSQQSGKQILASAHPTPYEHILSLQLGNEYFLIFLVGLFVLRTTNEIRVVRAFLWACLIGDVGHLAATGALMGAESLKDVGSWTPVVWGNIGFTVLLFVVRVAYLSGLLGADGEQSGRKTKGKVKGS
ncbi:MAG: hypothetical protein M1831_000743 [Alyxoria varia]|nr:MAG: hypothetical protein M1831_000743 [Alyxoria varia]